MPPISLRIHECPQCYWSVSTSCLLETERRSAVVYQISHPISIRPIVQVPIGYQLFGPVIIMVVRAKDRPNSLILAGSLYRIYSSPW